MTGAGRGVGRATAMELARSGVRVALLARSADQLNEIAAEVHKVGGTAVVIQAHLGDPEQVDAAAHTARRELGVVDILINNAAFVWPLGASAAVDPHDWAAALTVHVVAPANLSFALLPDMLSQEWGRIVNVSSGIAEHPAMMLRANAHATSNAA